MAKLSKDVLLKVACGFTVVMTSLCVALVLLLFVHKTETGKLNRTHSLEAIPLALVCVNNEDYLTNQF